MFIICSYFMGAQNIWTSHASTDIKRLPTDFTEKYSDRKLTDFSGYLPFFESGQRRFANF